MKLRLAFGVATSISPEILILDEVFGAGDQTFFDKAKQRMQELIAKSSIVVLASHSRDIIEKFCNKILLLEMGKIKYFGDVAEGMSLYLSKKK
jgi:ABC-type polysaccharide/polyol phosphate transport system ATPase subunit